MHVRYRTREIYICVSGEGILEYGVDSCYPLKSGDIVDIAPGTVHALSAQPGKSVSVLVVSFPLFNHNDYEKVIAPILERKEIKPDFFIAAPSQFPNLGIIVVDTDFTLSQFFVKNSWKAAVEQEVFIISGRGTLHTKDSIHLLNAGCAVSIYSGQVIQSNLHKLLSVVSLQK